MPVISAYCQECGDNFYLRDEMYVPFKATRFRLNKEVKDPETWEDWILHISTHCQNCRISVIPEKCWDNYLKLKGD